MTALAGKAKSRSSHAYDTCAQTPLAKRGRPPSNWVQVIEDERSVDLTGKLLIAMPAMGDNRFAHSVVFICAHSAEGAMGLIVNKPARGLVFGEILDQLNIKGSARAKLRPVHIGGPVETARGFVLHSPDYTSSLQTMEISGFGMTATQDILEDIAADKGPEKAILTLGYAGWGTGQ